MSTTFRVGDLLPPLRHTATTFQLFRYSAVTWNPHRIHFDQAHARAVVQGQGRIEVWNSHYCRQRPEHFVSHYRMVGGGVGEQCRGNPAPVFTDMAWNVSAHQQSARRKGQQFSLAALVDHRPDLGLRVGGVAHPQRLHGCDQSIGESVVNGVEDEDAADRRAALPREAENGRCEVRRGGTEIGALIDDRRIASAELGLDRDGKSPGFRHDHSADRY